MRTSVVLGALRWNRCANVFLQLLLGLGDCAVCVVMFGVHSILMLTGVLTRSCELAGILSCVHCRLRRCGGRLSWSEWRGGPLCCDFVNTALSSCCTWYSRIGTSCCWRIRWYGLELLSVKRFVGPVVLCFGHREGGHLAVSAWCQLAST